jgi:hypothetical protein
MSGQDEKQPPGSVPAAAASAALAFASLAYLLAFIVLAPALSARPPVSGGGTLTSAYGLAALGGLGLSLLGVVLGGAGAAGPSGRRRLAVLGLVLNLLLFLLFAAALATYRGPVT